MAAASAARAGRGLAGGFMYGNPSCPETHPVRLGRTVTPRTIAVALVALAASTAILGACTSQPTSPAACRPTAVTHQGSLVQLVADPPESSIRAILPSAAPPAAGQPYEVRWLVDSRKASGDLRFQAQREGTGQLYREQVATSSVSGLIAEFQAALVFPANGCWDADISTGTALGSLTFRVV